MYLLKNLASAMYEKVLQQEYLVPLTYQQVYNTLQKSQRRKRSLHQMAELSKGRDVDKDLWAAIDKFATFTPEREFRMLGREPAYEAIKLRLSELRTSLQEVESIMISNYPTYKSVIDRSLFQAECGKTIEKNKKNAKQLKLRLGNMHKMTQLTKNISQKNIKIKNLKNTLNSIRMLPNLQKMNLAELKNLKIEQKIAKLNCLKNLDAFIQQQVSNQLRGVIDTLKVMIQSFDTNEYECAVRTFILAQHPSIKYENLLYKVLQNAIETKENDNLYDTLCFFVRILVNSHRIFSFHRQIQQDQGHYLNSSVIRLDRVSLQNKISQRMDQTLAYFSTESLLTFESSQIYRMLYMVNRFCGIGFVFCRYVYSDTVKEIRSFLVRRVRQSVERSFAELKQNLQMEDGNQWSRLPIQNDYRHQGLQRNLCIIKKYQQSQLHRHIQQNKLIYLQEQQQQNPTQQTWSIQNLSLPFQIDKIDKYRDQIKLSYPYEVVLCQSGLNVLRHLQNMTIWLFAFPIARDLITNSMIGYGEYYIYYLFTSFLSYNLQNQITGKFDTLEDRYLNRRISYKYKNLVKFVQQFKQNGLKNYPGLKADIKQSKKVDKIILRSRVVSSQSARFIFANLKHIFIHVLDELEGKKELQRIYQLQLALQDLTQILYVDSIPRLCNIESTITIIIGIKWGEGDYMSHIAMLEVLMKDFYNKIKGLGKGQIPQSLINNLFGVYWKTQLTFMAGTFIKEGKLGKHHKGVFQSFLDDLYKKILEQVMSSQGQNEDMLLQPYKRIKKILPILYESDWNQCFNLLKQSLSEYEYILRMSLNIMQASESAKGLSSRQLKQREEAILKWIEENLLSD